MSRSSHPKQFLPLVSDKSLFQETLARVATAPDGVTFRPPLVICGDAHVELITAQLAESGAAAAAIITEPMPRNTAAVAAVAAGWTAKHAPGALVLLMPADHHIADADSFRQAVKKGASAAARCAIVTLGVKPSEPHTGFGYIEAGAPIGDSVSEVAAFREKPDIETAKSYLAGGRHFWNAGIFLYSPDAMIGELHAFAPAIRNAACAALEHGAAQDGVLRLDTDEFAACPSDSIDYAVMEKTSRAAVVGPVDAGWSDIGSWTALSHDGDDANIAEIDSENLLIRTDGPFVGAVGVKDLVIIATGDAVLVLPRERAQDVKAIIEELKARGRADLL